MSGGSCEQKSKSLYFSNAVLFNNYCEYLIPFNPVRLVPIACSPALETLLLHSLLNCCLSFLVLNALNRLAIR